MPIIRGFCFQSSFILQRSQMQTHIRNTPYDNKYTTSNQGEKKKHAYIYTYSGKERQGTQYRNNDM